MRLKLLIVVLLAAALAACDPKSAGVRIELGGTPVAPRPAISTPAPAARRVPTATPAPPRPPAKTPAPSRPPAKTPAPTAPPEASYPTPPDGLASAPVVAVVDGDTLDVRLGGRRERVRLIGINTPESVDPRRPVECYGREASAKAKELLRGQTVLLEADPSQDEQDRFGRLLRYVWLPDGRLFNLEMVAQGYAFEYTFAAPYKYRDEFRRAQARARSDGLGLWSPDTCDGRSKPAAST